MHDQCTCLQSYDFSFNFIIFRSQFHPRSTILEKMSECADGKSQREYFNVNTFYPSATVCYLDPSEGKTTLWGRCISNYFLASCPDFGGSGSAIVRECRPYEEGYNFDQLSEDPHNPNSPFIDTRYQYSFVGPLSMSKGCDLSRDFNAILNPFISRNPFYQPDYIYRGIL